MECDIVNQIHSLNSQQIIMLFHIYNMVYRNRVRQIFNSSAITESLWLGCRVKWRKSSWCSFLGLCTSSRQCIPPYISSYSNSTLIAVTMTYGVVWKLPSYVTVIKLLRLTTFFLTTYLLLLASSKYLARSWM